jgi:hypothetical protein
MAAGSSRSFAKALPAFDPGLQALILTHENIAQREGHVD